MENALLKEIQQKSISKSILEEVSQILQISYDAAHRRISGKSAFTLVETVTLCQHYNLSMDNLFLQKDQVIMQKTKAITNIQDFGNYFEKTAAILQNLPSKETIIYYAAKDIPMNYAVAGTVYSKFKFFIWMQLLNKEQNYSFENFSFPENIWNKNDSLKTFFDTANRIEIWNDTTINSALQQVIYYYEAGLLHYQNAQYILEDIQEIIEKIEKNCTQNNEKFQLYYNELLILNNAALFYTPKNSAFFLPYNALGYFACTDKNTCTEQQQYLSTQLANSKSINKSGKKEQKIFFNKMYQKITFYKQKLESFVVE
jgi:BetR domain